MKPLILVIEDEPSVAENILYALETDGFKAAWHATAGAGRTALRNDPFDLIVLDVGLPDGSGFELCKEIRKTSAIPVVFLTARAEEVDRVVGLEIGADDYMVKPFSPRELVARVKAILRRTEKAFEPDAAEPPDPRLPFRIDAERFLIAYHGEPLKLTKYEFKILETFIRRPGRIFTREALMNQVWEEPDASMERTVDAHIKSLRAKLRAVRPEEDPIVTHRGLGYCLKESW